MNESGALVYRDKYGHLAAFRHRHVQAIIIGYLSTCCNRPMTEHKRLPAACSECHTPYNQYTVNSWHGDDADSWAEYQLRLRYSHDTMQEIFSALGLDQNILDQLL